MGKGGGPEMLNKAEKWRGYATVGRYKQANNFFVFGACWLIEQMRAYKTEEVEERRLHRKNG